MPIIFDPPHTCQILHLIASSNIFLLSYDSFKCIECAVGIILGYRYAVEQLSIFTGTNR